MLPTDPEWSLWQVSMGRLVPVLTGALQEMAGRADARDALIAELQAATSAQARAIAELQAAVKALQP